MQPQDKNGFRITHDDTIETVVAYYREQIAASQEILRTVDLDAPCAWQEMAGNLRWVAVHMIEETARTLATLTSSARPSTAAARNNELDAAFLLTFVIRQNRFINACPRSDGMKERGLRSP